MGGLLCSHHAQPRTKFPTVPQRISYGHILQIFFSIVHDPTELDRQGPDTGTQYRSAIFPISPEHTLIAKAYIAQLDAAHVYAAPIVTEIEPDRTFYPAEAYHQNYPRIPRMDWADRT